MPDSKTTKSHSEQLDELHERADRLLGKTSSAADLDLGPLGNELNLMAEQVWRRIRFRKKKSQTDREYRSAEIAKIRAALEEAYNMGWER